MCAFERETARPSTDRRAGARVHLKAALAALAPDATVVVAEIVAAVIDWNRNPAFKLPANGMEDSRVTVLHRDVREAIGEARGDFDSIILDVDNGPGPLSTEVNRRLYRPGRIAIGPHRFAAGRLDGLLVRGARSGFREASAQRGVRGGSADLPGACERREAGTHCFWGE